MSLFEVLREAFILRGPLWFRYGGGINSETLSGAKTIAVTAPHWHDLDPGGAHRDVNLPASGQVGDRAGMWYGIRNAADAAENLVVKTAGGATVHTIQQSESAIFVMTSAGTWKVAQSNNQGGSDWGVGGIKADVIAESTATNGVAVDGLRIKDAAITPLAGGAAWLDLLNVATGEAIGKIKTNLANALEFKDTVANVSFLKFITTTGAQSLATAVALTTTDGVVSGTARKVGGQAFASTSTTDAVTAVASNGSHVDFAQTYSIPANTIKAGTHLKVRAMVRVTNDSGADTLEVKLYLGGTTLVTTTAFDPSSAGDFVIVEFDLWGHATPAAAAAVDGYGEWVSSDNGSATEGHAILAPTNHATNGALVVKASAKWSANTADTSCTLEVLDVEGLA